MNVRVVGAGFAAVNGLYERRAAMAVPAGFAKTCQKMGWPAEPTWKQLSVSGMDWFESSNGSYIYLHKDGQWWIDEPSGGGVYIADANRSAPRIPPPVGWKMLAQGSEPLPTVEIIPDTEL